MSAAGVLLAAVLLAGPAAPAPPQVRCELDDERVAEASGLVVSPGGPLVVNDSGNPSTVYRLGTGCGVAEEIAVRRDGRDVEDLARTADGTLWLADTGDNRRQRETVAILRVAPSGGQVDVRLAYPDGPHDVEAMIVPADGRPVLVTKQLGGRSGIYTTPAALPPVALPDAGVVTLRRVGELALPPSTTPNGGADAAAVLGASLVTGGALSADGRVAAVRTYTDAWLYGVEGTTADAVVAGLRTDPVQVPLPGEPQGEAIAFERDGTLLSASESPDEVGPAAATRRGALRAVPGAAALVGAAPTVPTPSAPPGPSPAAAPVGEQRERDGQAGLGPAGWAGVAVAIVVGGLGVPAALWWGRRRSR